MLEFNASEAIWKNDLRIKPVGAKRAENFWKNCHVVPNSRTDYVFSAFSRPEYLFPKSASPIPLPSESNACPLKEKKIVLAVHESIFS